MSHSILSYTVCCQQHRLTKILFRKTASSCKRTSGETTRQY